MATEKQLSPAVNAAFNAVNALFQENTLLLQMWVENNILSCCESSGSIDLNLGLLTSVSSTAGVKQHGFGSGDAWNTSLF